jgi:hypothetical protein
MTFGQPVRKLGHTSEEFFFVSHPAVIGTTEEGNAVSGGLV